MGRFRGWLGRLERDARGDLESFELLDGSRYYYSPIEAYGQMYLHALDHHLGRGEKWPEPPEIWRRIAEAKDLAAALERFGPDSPGSAFVDLAGVFDKDVLIHERRLVPLPVDPLPEDLSEQS